MTPEEQEALRNKDRAIAWPFIRQKAKSFAEAMHVMTTHMLLADQWPMNEAECRKLALQEMKGWFPVEELKATVENASTALTTALDAWKAGAAQVSAVMLALHDYVSAMVLLAFERRQ